MRDQSVARRDHADEDLLQELGSAAVQGRAALGERAGHRDLRVGQGSRDAPFS